jgi:methylenetetrahydrofolate dehydrogenase (NADP+)/methenyltetrahydrofolate cyclohydrolase/formyltetrahydrofolate synthetase
MPIREKIITIATSMYGAAEVVFSELAERRMDW